MGVEPLHDAPAVFDAIARLAARVRSWFVVGEAHELRLDTVQSKRDEELLGLLDRAAQVVFGVKE